MIRVPSVGTKRQGKEVREVVRTEKAVPRETHANMHHHHDEVINCSFCFWLTARFTTIFPADAKMLPNSSDPAVIASSCA